MHAKGTEGGHYGSFGKDNHHPNPPEMLPVPAELTEGHVHD